MYITYHNECRFCKNPHLVEVLDLGEQTIQGSFIYSGKPSPPTRKVRNKLVRCDVTKQTKSCGLVQNSLSILPDILYSNYGYRSAVAASMREHLEDVAKQVMAMVKSSPNPDRKKHSVLDIGSNDNTFLNFFPGSWDKTGFDPSDVAKESKQRDIKLYNECFPPERWEDSFKNWWFSVITSLSCLYDISDLEQFLYAVHNNLSETGVYVFEVAYLPTILERVTYEQSVLEHVATFSLSSLEKILPFAGLQIINAIKTETNNGSLLCFAVKKGYDGFAKPEYKDNLTILRNREYDLALDTDEPYKKFRLRVKNHGKELIKILDEFKSRGSKIYILGASTKLNVILNMWDIGLNYIDGASERDPRKVGAKTLSGIPIVSEEEARLDADVFLTGPVHFKKELLEREMAFLHKGGKIIFPSCPLEVVSKEGEIKIEI